MFRLAVSNIAWSRNDDAVLKLVSEAGGEGVELAPGKLGGWVGITPKTVGAYRDLCASFGLVIPSFQAILFGKPDLQLLGEEHAFKAMKTHMARVAELAVAAGARVMVFGAPKNRLAMGRSVEAAEELAKDRLHELADVVWAEGVSIGLEAVPVDYGGEIIKDYLSSLEIVREVGHPGLVFHLDAACTWLAGDSLASAITDAAEELRHFHISEPGLKDFSNPSHYHNDAGAALRRVRYAGWTSIEMRETSNPEESIRSAIREVRRLYLSPFDADPAESNHH